MLDKKEDMNSARLELTPSNLKIGHRDHLTILPKIHIVIFPGAQQTRDTPHTHTCTAQQKRERR